MKVKSTILGIQLKVKYETHNLDKNQQTEPNSKLTKLTQMLEEDINSYDCILYVQKIK